MNPSCPIRGVLLDAARQTETYAYYARLIPDLARWGYNTLFLHLFDDDGAAIRLPGPRLLTTPGALSVDQWQALTRLAGQHGIQVIPEVECLGHTGFLTRLPENADLREPPGPGGVYWSLNPFHSGAMRRIEDLIEQVAAIFPGPYLHIGMDEADLGGSPQSQAAMAAMPSWRIFGEHVLKIRERVHARGRQCLMWGDHLLKQPELRDLLPRDIVICNWLYGKNHRADYVESLRYFIDAGFSTLGCPSGNCWAILAPEREHLANLRDFAESSRGFPPGTVGGLVNTLWETYSMLPACAHPILDYGGRCFAGTAPDPDRFFAEFAGQQFGLGGAAQAAAGRGLGLLHVRRGRSGLEKAMARGDTVTLCARRAEVEDLVRIGVDAACDFTAARTEVRAHADEFAQWEVTAQWLADLADLCLGELESGGMNRDGRRALRDRFQAASRQCRSYAGTEDEEPDLGQIPRYWQDTDHPMTVLNRALRR